jgi:hypothetical protein
VPGCFVTSDTSYGAGVKSLRLGGGASYALSTQHPLALGTRVALDVDIFIRSGERLTSIMPRAATHFPHSTTIAWKDPQGAIVAGLDTHEGTWRLWNGTQWTESPQAVHYDVWNHVQLVVEEDGTVRAGVQPVGQAATPVGSARIAGAGTKIALAIDTSPTAGHISCYDNVLITSGPAAAP